MFRPRPVLCRLSLILIAIGGLMQATAFSATATTKIPTFINIVASPSHLDKPGQVAVFGEVSDGARQLAGAKVSVTARSLQTGRVTFSGATATNSSGEYRVVLNLTESTEFEVRFVGSPSYAASAIQTDRTSVGTQPPAAPTAPSGSNDSASVVLVPLNNIMCDGYGTLLGNTTTIKSPTSDIILGGIGDQATASCKGEKKSVLSSYVGTMKKFSQEFAAAKVLGVGKNEEIVTFNIRLFTTMNARVATLPPAARKAYRAFAQNSYNAISPVLLDCVKLPTIPQATACSDTVGKMLDRLRVLTFGA